RIPTRRSSDLLAAALHVAVPSRSQRGSGPAGRGERTGRLGRPVRGAGAVAVQPGDPSPLRLDDHYPRQLGDEGRGRTESVLLEGRSGGSAAALRRRGAV